MACRVTLGMDRLDGKTALVTGAASGIGLATVELFARRHVTVALNHLPDYERLRRFIVGTEQESILICRSLEVAHPGWWVHATRFG